MGNRFCALDGALTRSHLQQQMSTQTKPAATMIKFNALFKPNKSKLQWQRPHTDTQTLLAQTHAQIRTQPSPRCTHAY